MNCIKLKPVFYLLVIAHFMFAFAPVSAEETTKIIKNYGSEVVWEEFGNKAFIDRLHYFRDDSNKLTIDQVLNSSNQAWESTHPRWLNFGLTTDTIWVKADLPEYHLDRKRIVEIANHNITALTYYVVENRGGTEVLLDSLELGSHLPIKERPLASRNYLLPLHIPSHTSITVYLKVNSSSAMKLPINLWDQKSLSEISDRRSLIQGAYLGMVVIMGLYNICIAFFTRDSSYYFYSMMILNLVGYIAIDKGLAFNYLWPNSPGIDFQGAIFLTAVSCAASIPFTVSFLSVKQNAPKFYIWFKYLLIAWGVLILGTIFIPSIEVLAAIILVSIPGGISLIWVGIHTWRKGVPAAKFYTIAWALFVSCVGIHDFYLLGIYPISAVTEYALFTGSFLEITLLSLGLAWRIRSLDEEKQKANFLTTAKSEFLAAMSHEIRTPMNGILGMAEILRDTKLSQQQTSYLNTILGSGKTLLTVLNDILDYSKIESGKIELEAISFNVRQLIDESASIFAVKANEKNLYYNMYVSESVPASMTGDPTRIAQVINNFISNAFKFTEKGRVTIYVEKNEQGRLLVKIEDSGIGIPSDKIESVFDKFTQADTSTTRQYGGTGLGLPISKKFIEMMGGVVGVESVQGEGSTFWFVIPIENEIPFVPSISHKDEKTVEVEDEVKDVLVLSPDHMFNDEFSKYQNIWNFKWSSFATIEGALSGLENHPDPFNFIIIDSYCQDYSEEAILSKLATKPWAMNAQVIFLVKIGSTRKKLEKIKPAPVFEEYPVSITRLQLLISNASDTLITSDSEEGDFSSLKDLHVLVADDNKVNTLVITGYLKRLGIQPVLKTNGKDAFEAVRHSTRKFDLVLMDCEMPVMDGYEASKRIRKWEQEQQRNNSKTVICALSAHVMDTYREKCFEAGMDEFISKPIVFEELRALLKRCHPDNKSSNMAS